MVDITWSEIPGVVGASDVRQGARGEEARPAGHTAQAPERAAAALREAIAAGEIPPGTKLAEVALAQSLGVSRNTLRSAFQVLIAEGLARRHTNRGVFVHRPSAEDIQEIYRVRRIVETGAVRAAVFTQDSLAAMRAAVAWAARGIESGDRAAVAQGNQKFHQLLVAQARTAMLDELMERVLAQMRLIFASMHGQPDFHTTYVPRNRHLIELLADLRRQEAEAYLIDYLNTAENELLQHLAAHAGP